MIVIIDLSSTNDIFDENLISQKTTIGNETFSFMDANDWPHGILWQILEQSGANLELLERKLNQQSIYIESPEHEANKACAKVTDEKLLDAMKTQIHKRNFVYAIWLFKNRLATNK